MNIFSSAIDKVSRLLGGGSDSLQKVGEMVPANQDDGKQAAIRGFMGMKEGGKVSSASKRADGIAQRGKTRGKMY
jgi:hypothetical protein